MSHKSRDWWLTVDNNLILHEALIRKLLQCIHQIIHLGMRKMEDLV